MKKLGAVLGVQEDQKEGKKGTANEQSSETAQTRYFTFYFFYQKIKSWKKINGILEIVSICTYIHSSTNFLIIKYDWTCSSNSEQQPKQDEPKKNQFEVAASLFFHL